MRLTVALTVFILANVCGRAGAYLDDQFEMPLGFRIYRAATAELSGGSYDLCFDGQRRLLVGDGNAVRRLVDKDGDGIFDAYEVIATNVGWRGPQGLLVYGDRLFAVGGDGIQLFEGYTNGPLVHKGRIGTPFKTGGDHEAHTILRGHDGYIYFVTGDGGGAKDRAHITEQTSPVMFERSASVFRISPDGKKWECISAGGRNPPNLGMNYLGELFSLDSDMEWHVGLPWYRPVRLNHWAIGGDQGWQEVGAYPPYYIDCLPGILNVGRGSPDWGVFYEHTQLPDKYRNAYLVCDYRWKHESDDQYATTGRLLAFFLKRDGANWTAKMEVLARPKSNARDTAGKPISFALVDIEVAPDGSLYLSDHNQGIWRIVYESGINAKAQRRRNAIEDVFSLPQPGSEWSRLRAEGMLNSAEMRNELEQIAADRERESRQRLNAIRYLAPEFDKLSEDLLGKLATDPAPEIRGQAVWLFGIRGKSESLPSLLKLFNDPDDFVRRRAAEALTRFAQPEATESLIDHLADSSRLVRYISMAALAHRPLSGWWDRVELRSHPQIRLRGVVAAALRRESTDLARRMIAPLLTQKTLVTEDRLDLLRVFVLSKGAASSSQVANYVLKTFPDPNRDVRWEQIRVLGEFAISDAFPKLLVELEMEKDSHTQFHIAQALSKLASGWNEVEERRAVDWFVCAQKGWFAEFAQKGVEFPLFWSTTISEFASHHREAVLRRLNEIQLSGALGAAAINLIAQAPNAADRLLEMYRAQTETEARLKIVRALKQLYSPNIATFLRSEYRGDAALRGAILQTLASQPVQEANIALFQEGLSHNDREVVRASADALIHYKPALSEELSRLILGQMLSRRETFYSLEKLLSALSGTQRKDPDMNRRLDDKTWAEATGFWRHWHEEKYGRKFEQAAFVENSDEAVHRFLSSDQIKSGDGRRGAGIYEALQCQTCHSGGITPGREGRFFGPDLAGVTRRLSRADLADALVFPSRQVPERYKAHQVELKDETVIVGFITEQNDREVTVADAQQVRKLPRAEIKAIRPQSNSLMPDHLLNRLSWDELRDLFAFLDEGPGPQSASK